MTNDRRHAGRLPLVVELPLALASYLFYRLMRGLFRPLIAMNARRNPARARQWSTLGRETLKLKLALPAIMTSGPRWNTHAVISAAGPFSVAGSLAVDVQTTQASAELWTVVIHRFPSQQLVGYIGSAQAPFAGTWQAVSLPAGRYALALRYYGCKPGARLPAVRVDGVTVIPESGVPEDALAIYADVSQRRGALFSWLHYHVFTMLRFRHRLPQAFIERALLPIGNPETQFRYGILYRGESLQLEGTSELLADYDVYATVYSRDSFPKHWGQARPLGYQTPPVTEDSFYVVRLLSRRAGPPAPIEGRLALTTGQPVLAPLAATAPPTASAGSR